MAEGAVAEALTDGGRAGVPGEGAVGMEFGSDCASEIVLWRRVTALDRKIAW